MNRIAWLVRSLTVNGLVACVTVGIAFGVTNVLVNHVQWLGPYLNGWVGAPSPTPPASAGNFVEESGFFNVTINGRTVRLQGLTVKRAGLAGRLPIALIAHGKDSSLANMRNLQPSQHIGPARDLAQRGWLAVVVLRRGFGHSDGPTPGLVSCKDPSFVARLSADADDLQATLEFIAHRPDADPTRVIAIGVSAGGAAVVALSARNPPHLLGVINISGGLRPDSCPNEDLLVSAFKEFGAKSRVPNLWLYAKNDSLFGPDLAGSMRSAFLDGGGDVKLVMYEPIAHEGHLLFSHKDGRLRWFVDMDAFLRVHKLPTSQHQAWKP
jgi:dienelactone hydrolase